jgi:hypothetical protein
VAGLHAQVADTRIQWRKTGETVDAVPRNNG